MIYKGNIFKNRKFNFSKLKKFGFIDNGDYFSFEENILNDTFKINVKILKDNTVDTDCIECSTGEKYNLIYVKDIEGEFVGRVKEGFYDLLCKIKENCTDFAVFKTKLAELIIEYVVEKYGANPEYLWEKFPNNAVFRKRDNSKTGGKWFLAILTASKKTIGLIGEGEIEVIDLKGSVEKIEKIVDNKRFFKGYHMNKKHWYTICLDDSVSFEEIKKHIDESYSELK